MIWSPNGAELCIKHTIVITGRDEKFNTPKSDLFIWNAPKYGRDIQIFPKNMKFSNGKYITIESRKMKHKRDDTAEFESYNRFTLGESTFLYMLETLASIENKFKTIKDLFLYNEEDKRPLSVNPKYNKAAWIVRSWGRVKSYISFTPHVLADNDSNYIGLKLTSSDGFIGELSWDQFLLFKLSLEGLIRNFYQASLELYNMAMNNIILDEIAKNSGK